MSKKLDLGNLLHGSTKRAKEKFANLHHHFIYHMWDKIPFDTGGNYKSLVVVPIDPKALKLHALPDSLKRYKEKLQGLLLTAPNPRAQQKYTKSMAFIQHMLVETQKTVNGNPEFREQEIWGRVS